MEDRIEGARALLLARLEREERDLEQDPQAKYDEMQASRDAGPA